MSHGIRQYLVHFLAVVVIVAVGVGVGVYILDQQGLRFPLIEEAPFTLEAELEDAHGVKPGQGQTVRVAGVRVGVIGEARLEDGRAVLDLELEPKWEGLVREDATALLRPRTALKDMFLELDPGSGRPLHGGERISIANTAPDVDLDEILATLDGTERDYLRVLVTAGGKGARGRGGDLREALKSLEPLHRDVARVSGAIAERRRNLRRLVHRYGLLVDELGRGGDELARLVRSADAAFGAIAAEDSGLRTAVARLPGALRATRGGLADLDRLSVRLAPALEALRPAVRRLDPANEALTPLLRDATPVVRGQLRPLARRAQPFLRDLGTAAGELASAGPDVRESLHELNRLLNIGAFNPGGAEPLSGDLARDRDRQEGFLYWFAWAAQNTVSLFSTSDAHGPFRRISLGGVGCQVLTSLLGNALSGVPEEDRGDLEATLDGLTDALGDAGVCAAAEGAGP